MVVTKFLRKIDCSAVVVIKSDPGEILPQALWALALLGLVLPVLALQALALLAPVLPVLGSPALALSVQQVS